MPIHFSDQRLSQVLDAHTRWWRGELDRPLANVAIADAYRVERRAAAPVLSQETCADLRWTPEQLIEALDEDLSRWEFLADSFPFVNFSFFGPGVLSALCGGARLDNSSGRVWFFPVEEKELCDIHVRYDPENLWAQRIKALYRAGRERWGEAVVMGMPDLGGVLDVMAALRGSENLLLDLYDCPEEVLRVRGEIEEAWYAAYEDFHAAMGPGALYSDWSCLLSAEPSYILQCDFCYMIGNPMFRSFVLDTLRRDTQRLAHTIYHLDGIGELNHLADVCALSDLNAVQWVFGDGQPGPTHWLEVYRTILSSGKRIWITGGGEEILETVSQLHGAPYILQTLPLSQKDLAERLTLAR